MTDRSRRYGRRGLSTIGLLSILLLGLAAASVAAVHAPTYSYGTSQSPDVVVAGGLDGRVYAVNAWTGEVLWSFDSGGPMVDSSQCLLQTTEEMPPTYHSATARREEEIEIATMDVDGNVQEQEVEQRSAIQQQTASTKAMTASAAFMSQLVPSYDGRLYHFSNSKVKELDMTMADIVSGNGPVRLAVDRTTPSADESTADILLFGEKKLEMFALDAVSGFRRPYSSVASTAPSSEILFGRSEFMTRAVHSRNVSSARCFKISEFFMDFAQQARCSVVDSGTVAPEILVLPKDSHSTLDDEGSTIVAYDPWTSEQLWEFEVPNFDVLAVFGVSTMRGATFFQWKVDGPSSTATNRPTAPAQITSHRLHRRIDITDQHDAVLDEDDAPGRNRAQEVPQTAKELVNVVPHTWDAMESRFRLRLLGENYFLESNEGESIVKRDPNGPSRIAASFHGRHKHEMDDIREDVSSRRRRRILWEPIVNDGKQGVFITYTHVGAMLLGVVMCGALLAWGCYVKGLSASLAQSAIKSMDRSQFFTTHMHRLTIQRPGEEDITISSVITRSLMLDALGLDEQFPLLENGVPVDALSTELSSTATETMIMEKFSRLAANEAAAILARGGVGHSVSKVKMLADDPDENSNATTATTSSASSLTDIILRGVSTSSSTMRLSTRASSVSNKRLALPCTEEEGVSDVFEVEMLPASETKPDFFSVDADLEDSRFELADSDDDIFMEDEESVIMPNMEKSISSSEESDTAGSCCSNHNRNSARLRTRDREDTTTDEKSSAGKSSAQESSDASSSESGDNSATEVEVLFPFVCQSRFVNEFEEISAIGKGGFGQVMLAENRLDGRKYAIKRVGLNLKNQTSKTLQKFLREVKILALLDHTNIVRYYQAWLEKVEESTKQQSAVLSSLSSDSSSLGGLANARNYSTSNLLAPISELEFSGNQRQLETFYSNGSMVSDGDEDDGFEWERGSLSGVDDGIGWKEEDLIVQNKPRTKNLSPGLPSNHPPGGAISGEDTSFNATEKCDHWLYIQMQYCAGRNLADYLAVPTRPMELSRMLKIFVQIASALAHVHSCGLIHRDLKPANIFVADTEKDEIKLGDFGLSRYAANANNLNASTSLEDSQPQPISSGLKESSLSTSIWSNMSESNEVTAGVGTYLYASPEQVAGKKYNAKTDIYSLGMILFELCHERFGTTMERYITLRDARDSKFPPDLRAAKRCPEILDMLRKLLSHDPITRPTANEVVQWGQMMYETSLVQKALDVVRSPRNLAIARAGSTAFPFVPGIDHLMASSPASVTVLSSIFSLKVEAVMEHSGGDEGGERRLPNHNLLKQVCDVIASVSDGKVEIKKCGLHMESEGVTILEFELDPQAALIDAPGSDIEGFVVAAIEALADVQIVHRVSMVD
ncbi:hypothetical protein PHYBOEH_008744 [Phytophthora boehmeriae]|uniref:non-specific serine/threonine protein kinase n=1 Tax=Phytophthora boehmeriae TaxID=109152 RepID=A0A8T1X6K6_9STRA|nr:hypothetical protein PHYBOEH_008744 [Phytophthora boehmeriae]